MANPKPPIAIVFRCSVWIPINDFLKVKKPFDRCLWLAYPPKRQAVAMAKWLTTTEVAHLDTELTELQRIRTEMEAPRAPAEGIDPSHMHPSAQRALANVCDYAKLTPAQVIEAQLLLMDDASRRGYRFVPIAGNIRSVRKRHQLVKV